jgi:hypothetical protein
MSMDRQPLVIGNTYFSLMYIDDALSVPEIETLVYLGRSNVASSGGSSRAVHLFQYAASYLGDGNWNEMPAEKKEQLQAPPVVFFELEHIEPICDPARLIEQLQEWRARSN